MPKILCKFSIMDIIKVKLKFFTQSTNELYIYFVSDEEIKKGDFVIEDITGKITKIEHELGTTKFGKKIEATTDMTLNLPLIPKGFVKKLTIKKEIPECVYISSEVKRNAVYFNNAPSSTGQPDYDWNNTPKEMAGYRDEVIIITTKLINFL